MTTSRHPVAAIAGGRSVALWAGVIGAPVAWAVQLNIGYALTPKACGGTMHVVMHVLTVAFLLAALVGVYFSWKDWKSAGRGSPDETDGGPRARDRFLGALGMALGVLSAVVIVAQGIASFFFDGCMT